MIIRRLFLLLGTVVAVSASASYAQVNTMSGVGGSGSLYGRGPYARESLALDEGIEKRNYFDVGGLSLHPRIAVLAVDEDNVFLSDKEQTSDSYVVVSPGVLARYGGVKKNYFYVDLTADVPFGYSEDDEDIDNYQVSTVGNFQKGKSNMNGVYRFRDLRAGDIVIGNRVTKQEHYLSGAYQRSLNRKTSMGVNASYGQHEFDADDYTDFDQVRVGASGYWKALDKTRFSVDGNLGFVNVDSRVNQYGDAEYYEVGLGFNTVFSERWSTDGRVGYQVREFDRDEIDSVEGITGAFGVDGLLFEHVQAGINFWSLIQPAVNEAGATLTETRVEPTVSRRVIIEDLVASASVVFGRVDYESPDNQGEIGEIESETVFNDRKDEYFGYTFNLDWQVQKNLNMGVGYSYIENEANQVPGEESVEYEATRWMLRAQYNF